MIISRGWDAKSVLWCVGSNDADDLTSLDIQHAVLLGSACFFFHADVDATENDIM